MEGNVKHEQELKKVIRIDEGRIQEHLDEKVRQSLTRRVEALCKAKCYERTEDRQDTRSIVGRTANK